MRVMVSYKTENHFSMKFKRNPWIFKRLHCVAGVHNTIFNQIFKRDDLLISNEIIPLSACFDNKVTDRNGCTLYQREQEES